MRITGVHSTDFYRGSTARPLQLIRVQLRNDGGGIVGGQDPVMVTVNGPLVTTPEPAVIGDLAPGAEVTAEVGVEIAAPAQAGSSRPVTVIATAAAGVVTEATATITVAEPGWVMWMVSHFHYDPVWWNTQGQFLQTRLLLPDDKGELPEVR